MVSLVLRGQGLRDDVLRQLARVLPGGQSGDAFAELESTVDAVRQSTGLLGTLGIAGLVWTGSALFSTVETAFSRLMGFRRRGFARGKLMAVGMIVVFAVLLLLGVGASAALALITPVTERAGGGDVLGGPTRYLLQVAVGMLVGVLLFGLLYAVVPLPHPRRRQLLPGALLAGAGFELLGLIWPLYLGLAGGGNRYGQTFGLIVVVSTYVYFLAQLLMLGAVLNTVLAEGRDAAAS